MPCPPGGRVESQLVSTAVVSRLGPWGSPPSRSGLEFLRAACLHFVLSAWARHFTACVARGVLGVHAVSRSLRLRPPRDDACNPDRLRDFLYELCEGRLQPEVVREVGVPAVAADARVVNNSAQGSVLGLSGGPSGVVYLTTSGHWRAHDAGW